MAANMDVTRRDLLSAALVAGVSSSARASPVAYPLYVAGAADQAKMLAWLARFRRQYNKAAFVPSETVEERLSLSVFGKSIAEEKIAHHLTWMRAEYGRMLTPVTADSVAFRPEDAILYYFTTLEESIDKDELQFTTMAGSHDCVAIRVRFDLTQPANRVGRRWRIVEIETT